MTVLIIIVVLSIAAPAIVCAACSSFLWETDERGWE